MYFATSLEPGSQKGIYNFLCLLLSSLKFDKTHTKYDDKIDDLSLRTIIANLTNQSNFNLEYFELLFTVYLLN